VQFGYGLNYLIDIENAVIVDVEPTPARTYDEVTRIGLLGIGDLSMLKTSMCRERLEIFAPPPYRGGHDHDDFRFRFAALVPLS
jgi:hypothetical protein